MTELATGINFPELATLTENLFGEVRRELAQCPEFRDAAVIQFLRLPGSIPDISRVQFRRLGNLFQVTVVDQHDFEMLEIIKAYENGEYETVTLLLTKEVEAQIGAKNAGIEHQWITKNEVVITEHSQEAANKIKDFATTNFSTDVPTA